MSRDVHPEAVALIKKHDERLRCTVYMGEDWVREYVAQDAITEALRQRDAMLEACKRFFPTGVATDNKNVGDDVVLPLDVTMGELRQLRAAMDAA